MQASAVKSFTTLSSDEAMAVHLTTAGGHKTQKIIGGAVMKKSLFASILVVLIGGFFASAVVADESLVSFKGGIGVIPVSNVAGTANPDGTFPNVTPNIVRTVNPAPQSG